MEKFGKTVKKRSFLIFVTDGLPIIGTLLALSVIFFYLKLLYLAVPLSLFCIFAMNFFRDPERYHDDDPGSLVSPADGKIIELVNSVKFSGLQGAEGEYKKVSIFMSVVSVHVNRAPWSGRVVLIEHRDGKFYPADEDEASEKNECNYVLIEDERTKEKFLVKQIAGILARRIVCWVEPQDVVQKGERFGMIKFGSRVELFMPKNFEFKVQIGQMVKAGETTIGTKNEKNR